MLYRRIAMIQAQTHFSIVNRRYECHDFVIVPSGAPRYAGDEEYASLHRQKLIVDRPDDSSDNNMFVVVVFCLRQKTTTHNNHHHQNTKIIIILQNTTIIIENNNNRDLLCYYLCYFCCSVLSCFLFCAPL